MKRLEEFRKYYNHTIHPELMRLERQRIRLLRLLFFSGLFFICIFIFQLFLNILVVGLFMLMPISFYIAYLGYRIRRFILDFKPKVVNLVLDFIDDGLNYGTLKYESDRSISKEQFFKSNLFISKAQHFQGEDYISGKIGEMDFQLCELEIKEISQVSNRLEYVFRGIFVHAIFNEETAGSVILWPRHSQQFHIKAIKEFTWKGARNVDHEILNPGFRDHFTVYATEDTHVVGILSDPMQEAIMEYIERTGKEIYLSFVDKDIYAAITEPRDILEPYILRSNLSFDLVHEFFEDIHLALNIISDFDQTH